MPLKIFYFPNTFLSVRAHFLRRLYGSFVHETEKTCTKKCTNRVLALCPQDKKKRQILGLVSQFFFVLAQLVLDKFRTIISKFWIFFTSMNLRQAFPTSIITSWNNTDSSPTHDANDGFIIAQSSTKQTLTWSSSDPRD